MALHECPDCNTAISTSASACPHCGRPNSVDPESCAHPAFTVDQSWRPQRALNAILTVVVYMFFIGWIGGNVLAAMMVSSVGHLVGLVLAVFGSYFSIKNIKKPLVCTSCGRPAAKARRSQKSTSGRGSWNPVGLDRVPLVAPPADTTPLASKDESGGRQEGWHPDPAKSSLFRWWDGTAWTADVSRTGLGTPGGNGYATR
jgi:Protein of unknown function (DUF2510)